MHRPDLLYLIRGPFFGVGKAHEAARFYHAARRRCGDVAGCRAGSAGRNETSPPQISASGRRRRRAAGRVAFRVGASLSDATGAHRRRLSGWRDDRRHRTPHGSMAVGATWPAIRDREPAGCCQQYRRRSGREGSPRWHTLLQIGTPNAINATLYTNLGFNFIRDIAPVSGIMRVSYVIVVHPSVPATTVPEFIAYARANPGKINMASAGTGTPQHIYGELFKMMAGVDLVHVPYRGGAPAITDLLGGQVQVIFSPVPESISHQGWQAAPVGSDERDPLGLLAE